MKERAEDTAYRKHCDDRGGTLEIGEDLMDQMTQPEQQSARILSQPVRPPTFGFSNVYLSSGVHVVLDRLERPMFAACGAGEGTD